MAVEPKKAKKALDDKNSGGPNNNIVLNPELKEANAKTAVVSFGRMNPPTIGHEKLVNKVKELAKRASGVAQIYLSHSQDAKKNPLSYDDKVMLAKEAFGTVIQKAPAKTLIDVMKSLSGRFDNVVFVAGADRVQEFTTLLNKYNGKEFNFKSIEVVSAGERDPDAEGVEGMSASKMRAAASSGDAAKFKTGLPKNLQKHADDVYSLVRGGMKLSEAAELEEHVLSVAERMRRAINLRRIEKKMQMSRARLRSRIADTKHLEGRARKKAIQIIRKKVAGEKGLEYSTLSPSEKIMIDKRVEERKRAITKIAARLLPTVRKAEFARVALLHQGGQAGTGNHVSGQPHTHVNEAFEQMLENEKYHAGLSSSTTAKRKAHFAKYGKMADDNPDAYKPAPGDATAKTKTSVHTRRYHMMYNGEGALKYDRRFRAFRHIVRQEQVEINSDEELMAIIDEAWTLAEHMNEEKSMEGLKKKAEKSGISYSVLKSVYNRGVAAWKTGHRPGTTPQQWGYARVNSFITKGPGTWGKADSDLASKVRSESINESFGQFVSEGVNDPSIFKAVFLAGGPGSGKSFIVGKTALTALGMKVINSDDIFERALAKAGLKATPEDIYSPRGQEIRGGAKELTGKKMDLALNGRLGLVIDGTGKDYDKIEKQAGKLKKLGYEVAMIFVNTDLDTAKTRNRMRARSLPDAEVETMWTGVQKNLGKFQNFFGTKMFIIDNSEGSNFEGAVLGTYRKMSAWAKTTPNNPEAKAWIASQKGLKEDKKSFKHELGIGVSFKHMAKDALRHVDNDLDGDVDEYDFKKAVPDETNAAPDLTKKFLKKYAGEKKHTQVGVAFEQTVLQTVNAVIPPMSKDVNTKAEVDSHIEKHTSAALTRAQKLKHFRAYNESYGAGFEGTDDVVQNYKAATPGETGTPKKPKISNGVNEGAGLWHNMHQRRKKGLPKLKPGDKNYPKSLNVNEAFESMMEAEEADIDITASKMKDFEKFVDRMFEKFKIDFEFTKHFGERMNDERNSPKIKLKELADLIKKIYAKNGNPLKGKAGAEVVVKDLQSDLNMPIVVKYDEKNDEIDIVAKTIMRKKNFSTPNTVVKY